MKVYQYLTGEEAKLAAIHALLASYPDYRKKAMVLITNLYKFEGTGEDIRVLLEEALGPPPHFNIWGPLIHHALKLGHLHYTGEIRHMKRLAAKARLNPVYRSTDGWDEHKVVW